MEEIRIEAEKIKHPILKPINIDFRDGVSPEEAAIIAVLANPSLVAARDQRGIATAQLLQAGILPNPQLSYSMDVPTGGSTQETVNGLGLGIDLDITDLLTRGERLDAARAYGASVDLDIAWQEWQVAQAAKLHVYRLVFLDRELGVAHEEQDGLRKNLEAIKQAVNLGDMTVIDLSAAKAALQEAHASILTLDQQHEQERLELNQALGIPPQQSITLQSDIKPPSPKTLPSLESIINGIEERRLDLLALRMGYESQEARLREAVRAQFPRINLGFARLRDTGNVVTTGFSITLDMPFFDHNQGRIAIERASRKQLFDEYLTRLSDARSESAHILADMKSTKEQIEAAMRSVKTLNRLVQTYHRALLEGNADILNYYNTRRDLMEKRVEVLKLKQNLADMTIALEIAAGRTIG
jgi:outer membrane protein TolC